MAITPQRVFSLVTKSQSKVLAALASAAGTEGRAIVSNCKLARLTGLSRPTVSTAIDRLNELQLIRSFTPPRPKPSEHTLLYLSSERPGTKPLAAGARGGAL